jgi:hypothetical protein
MVIGKVFIIPVIISVGPIFFTTAIDHRWISSISMVAPVGSRRGTNTEIDDSNEKSMNS